MPPTSSGRPVDPVTGRRAPLRARPHVSTVERTATPPPLGVRAETPVLLAVEDVSVRFGGLAALSDVNLEVRQGEIVGLIGPNGAGKTTLMECISGFQTVTAGRIRYRRPDQPGELSDLLAAQPSARAGLGIGRTLQNVRLFPYLTVLDNLRIALHRHQRRGAVMDALSLPAARNEERETLAEAERLIELFGMQAFTEKYASELSYGTLRLLELAAMLALKATLLLLDEPASGISQKETEALGPLLRRIKAQTGATILMIEHDMSLVMGLADWIYCLDAGQNLSTGDPATVKADPAVIEAYLGTPRERQMVAAQARKDAREAAGVAAGETLLELEDVDASYGKVQVLTQVNVTVRKGERIALLGTNGAGKSTILKAASGLLRPTSGTVRWKGEPIDKIPAEQLVRKGLAQVPGGRGLFPTLSVGENLRMGGYIYDDAARVEAEMERSIGYFPWIRERFDQAAGTLSGGEQQQLATARALMSRPELLMIDELSLGLAPIVIERLMETVQRLHEEEGVTVVIVEQQASFALGYTDRAYFLEKGTVRYDGPSAGLSERPDLLRSVFLAGAAAGFADPESGDDAAPPAPPKRRRRTPLRAAGRDQ
ncbi:MAG: ATP-binding cassette domain-containing protein [Acidimicrobiales bacterium]